MKAHRRTILFLLFLLPLPACAASPCAAQGEAPPAARAVELYDLGRYAEARPLLEQLATAGKADGALLYRLFFAQRATGSAAESAATLARARESLEHELPGARGLEVPFYLTNAYQNLNQREEAARLAAATTSRVERGELAAADGLDKFRIGKLYADQGKDAEASTWYRAALDALKDAPASSASYLVWASRWLADRALAMKDDSAAEIYLTALATHGQPTVEELDRLAQVRVRNEMYAQAADAWRRAVTLNPGEGDRARYCSQLADMAARLKAPLPDRAPAGKPWSEMTREELEKTLLEQADVVRQARIEAGPTGAGVTPQRLEELRRRIDDVKPQFVAAALEYALHGYDIRETAFLGGYAPLIFRRAEWKLTAGDGEARQAAPPPG